jgi:hypothetical protein
VIASSKPQVWVNVAFTSVFGPFTQIEPAEYKRVTQVSYLGYVYATRIALDRMLPRTRAPSRTTPAAGSTGSGERRWALCANKVASGILDRYLARTGYRSQQTDQPRDPDQPVNLWEPADGPQGHDFDTHGIFDDRSTLRRYQLWASQHHALLATVGAGAVALVGVLATRAGTPRLGQTGS